MPNQYNDMPIFPDGGYGAPPMNPGGYGGGYAGGDPYIDAFQGQDQPNNGKKKKKSKSSKGFSFGSSNKKKSKDLTASERVKKLTQICGVTAGIAVVALGFGIYEYTSSNAAVVDATRGATAVVVASSDIERGARITADNIKAIDIPAAYRSADAISWEDREQLLDKVTVTKISSGSQLSFNDTIGEENRSSLAQVIPEGYEAITISVSDEGGFSNLLKIGDVVRVLVYIMPSGSDTYESSDLATAKVIALGGSLDDIEDNQYSTVTLCVTKNEATRIRQAQKEGELACMLQSYANADLNSTQTGQNTTQQGYNSGASGTGTIFSSAGTSGNTGTSNTTGTVGNAGNGANMLNNNSM